MKSYIDAAALKKHNLLNESIARYSVRATLAGIFLTFGSAIGFMLSENFNGIDPAIGKFLYAAFFPWGLIFIIFLNGELATSNMMYLSNAAHRKTLTWSQAFKVLLFCTLFNFVGSVILSFALSKTAIFSNVTPDHYMFHSVHTKITKPVWLALMDGILANILVNVAIIGTVRLKEETSKIVYILGTIFIFAYFGFEHVIANFGSFTLAYFVNPVAFPELTISNMLVNWVAAFVGNFIGGGLIMGIVYSWLNQSETEYLD